MTIDFTTIDYLKDGNQRQRQAYTTLKKLKIFEHLANYQPILAGTIPIGIDLPDSDLDIICCCGNHCDEHGDSHQPFAEQVSHLFAEYDYFEIKTVSINDVITTIAKFNSDGFWIEIFAQNIPTMQQNAYRHMLIEHHILQKQGSEFRSQIIALKASGLKTEPAFAQLLGLEGDPYKALLEVKN